MLPHSFSVGRSLKRETALYEFSSFTFTNCGQTGRTGPSSSQCNSTYSGQAFITTPSMFSVNNGVQRWIVPETASYRIEARGAQGGSSSYGSPGTGAIIRGDFSLTAGQAINMVVGQRGENYSGSCGAAGGAGGTFVVFDVPSPTTSDILVIAGGGGGAGRGSSGNGRNASTGTSGTNSTDNRALGGSNGSGGGVAPDGCSQNEGTGGAGFLLDGGRQSVNRSVSVRAYSYLNGSLGATASLMEGGFGGGGGTRYGGGGGGGYSGGGAGSLGGSCTCSVMTGGGGGGSYNAGTNPYASTGNSGHGSVIITKL